MVISKNAGKRKKKEIATATEPATELPKRSKVHAQRKFAQGQGQNSSSSLSLTAASQSQQTTPVKDSQPSELLPNLRPNTEDFLTFLCFRGTSVLPSHLDYLNTNKKTPVIVDTTENSNKSATNFDKFEEINKGEEAAGSSKDKLSKSLPVSLLSNNANVEVKSEEQQIVKPPFIPFAVRKHAETVIEGKRRQTVQALKKKYQEQRMAKSKLKSIAARPTVQGRKTRSAKRIEDDAQKASIETELKDSMEKDTTSPIKKETQTEKKQMEKEVSKTESALDAQNSRKTSLRNSGFVEPADKVQKIEKPTKSSNRVQSNTVVGAVKPISVQLPVQTETKKADDKLQNSFSPKTRRGRAKKETISEDMPQNKTKKETATKTEVLQKQPSRVTRQKSLNLSHQIEDENEKNTMKLTEKLSVNESQTDKTNENAKDPNVSNVSLPIKRIKKEEEFSSDDDEPLAKAIKKSPSDISVRQTNRRKNKKGFTHTKNTAKEIKDEISIVSEKSTKSNEALSKRKRTDKDKPRKQISKRGQSPKLNPLEVDNISNIESTPNLNSSDTNLPKFKKAIDQRKRKSDMTDLFPLDQSENEARTSRPMRKTKTAAAIYMELIGQKLNLGEFDDDNYSMDSFPELPNVRKTEQMENELKANIGKEKGKLVKARKKAQSKKIDDPDHGNTEEKMTAKKKQKAKKVDEIIPVKEGNVKDEVINATANITSAITITATIPTTATITTTTTAITTNTVATNVKKKRYSKKADVDTAESLVLLAQGGSPKKLEKSFSDSDDEPLAVKATKKSQKLKNARRSKDESSEAKVVILSSELVIDKMETKSEIKSDDKETLKNQLPDIEAIRRPKIESIKLDVIPHPKAPDQFTKPIEKEVIVSTSRPYQENALQLLSPTINLSPMKSNKEDAKIITPFKSAESNSPAAKSNTSQAISSILANLMPSKEESGKIFGIASVSLAQSSGPNDTKCTLGKCGSIHKPSLGPVVPTETFLLNDQMSSKERRKAKVNMTHEQIQKWLTECSDKAEYPEEDFLDDDIDLSTPPKPINYMITPSPFRELIEKDSASTSTRLSKPKSTPSMREKLSSIPKGPSLKAKPVVLKEDRRNDTNESTFDTFPENKVGDEKSKNVRQSLADNISKEVINQLKFADKPKESRSERQPFISKDLKQRSASPQPEPSNTIEDLSKKNKVSHSKPAATSSKTAHTPTSVKSTIPALDKKPIYNQKRTPVYNTKIVETTTKPKPVVNSFGAFSPENEPSIYSFDKEEDNIPTSTPFRRHSRRESSSTSKIDDTDRLSKKGDMSIKPDKSTESTPKKTVSQQQAVSLTLSPEDNSKSASIAVQVSMDVASLPKPKSSGDGNDSDSEGHTFYIPLQGTNVTGSKSDQLIQGVAVKLGTEGPEGPNQRVIMHAKLVTKAQMGSNTTPIPEAMANVHEIVKSLIACKESSSKSVPVGTVQPRFKSSGDVAATSSTSLQSSVAQQQSGSGVSRQSVSKQRYKYECTIKPSNNTVFPRHDDPAQMVEALTFRPTDKEFHDPIEFIERITPVAARFGLCRIIPPASFKPECNISDDMRFRAYNLYVHKMLHRWGPSAKEFSAIRKYLATQRITLTHPPWIGGMEVDLPRLYHTVQELGGLKEVIEKKKWPRVAEEMCIPKSAQDRVTKLDDIYCKYLLPYDTLSPAERQKLFDEVEADWAKAEAKARRNADRSALNDEEDEESEEDDDEEVDNSSMECIVKGRNMPLSAFFRIARNTMALWFKNTEPTSSEVETEFWRHVAVRDSHVCVHSGSIDSSGRGYGFPAAGNKAKAGAKHPWNLKVLTNNQGSILRSIGPVTGVTVPTLHVGMLFSACCWYRDPHGLPWIEYLHTGGSKIWYGVPDEQSANFRAAFTSLVPTHCQNKTVWLPCDTAMVPPHMLTDRGVSLCRTEQEPGQFVIVFPRAYTSSLCTGYSISESVYFATNSWLNAAEEDFKDIHDSCEPAMFSLEQLLFAVASDIRTNSETLAIVLPMITKVYEREIIDREKIKAAGVAKFEMVPVKDSKNSVTDDFECDTCRANLYISWIKTEDDNIYCLQHGLKYLTSKQIQAKDCKLITTFTIEDIAFLINKIKEKGEQQPQQTSRKLSLKKQQTLGGSK